MNAGVLAPVAGLSAVLVVAGLARLMAVRRLPGPARPARADRAPGPVARTRWGRVLARRLERGGMAFGPGALVGMVAGGAGVAAFAVAGPLGLPWLIPAVVAIVVAGAATFVRSGEGRRLARIEGQLPRAAHALAASLAAGLSLRQALARAARDLPDPLAEELRTTVDELRLGARIEGALENLMARVPARDLRVMVTAILVQRHTGGDLARALSVLADRLDERVRLARELRGATAQARVTAWMVAALPVAAGVMAEVAAPGTLRGALGQPPGSLLAMVSAAMYALGVLWIRRIGRVEV